jgi:hypothetical protein
VSPQVFSLPAPINEPGGIMFRDIAGSKDFVL